MSTEPQQSAPEALSQAGDDTGAGSLLDLAVELTPLAERNLAERNLAEDLIRNLVVEANRGTIAYDKNVVYSLRQGIAKIDEVVSKQLAEIMHHERFQKLEGSWRGLHYLCKNSNTNDELKIKVLNCTKRELGQDFASASDFDQSETWRAVYEDEFGTPGGQPFGALVGDYEFENHPEDISLLKGVSGVAAAAFAPFITAPSPKLFGLSGWEHLPKLTDLKTTFDSIEYAQWKSFRASEDARFVAMTMPRTLARFPYGRNTQAVDAFDFEEVPLSETGDSLRIDHDKYCWMNSAYTHATKLTQAFDETRWCTRIRGRHSGGAVEDLPTYPCLSPEGDTVLNCPTEVPIPDRRDNELSEVGFISLSYYKGTDYAVFFGGQTVQNPKKYDEHQATENAAISARLPYIMASSRIAHYLKCMVRDHIGSFKQGADLEKFLNKWIRQYVTSAPDPNEQTRAEFPLAEAKITVMPIAGKPGSYNAVAQLRPWLQLEELNASVRMVTRVEERK